MSGAPTVAVIPFIYLDVKKMMYPSALSVYWSIRAGVYAKLDLFRANERL